MINSANTSSNIYAFATLLFSFPGVPNGNVDSDDRAKLKESIDQLTNEAKTGNEDAIELLINFSSGADPSGIRQLAKQSLLDLYKDPAVGDHTKSQILDQALALYERTNKIYHGPDSAFSPHEIAAPVLYLAGQRAHGLELFDTRKQINECLHGKLYPGDFNEDAERVENEIETAVAVNDVDGEAGVTQAVVVKGSEDLLDRGRFVRQEEMMNGAKTMFSRLKTYENCLDLNNEVAFNRDVKKNVAGLTPEKATAIAIVNTDGHWVVLTLQRAEEGKVNCCVADSNFNEGSQLPDKVKNQLKNALNDTMGEFEFVGKSMQQDTPNACGALATHFVSVLDSNPDVCKPGFNVKNALEKSADDFMTLTSDQKNAMVTGIRAGLYGACEQVMNVHAENTGW